MLACDFNRLGGGGGGVDNGQNGRRGTASGGRRRGFHGVYEGSEARVFHPEPVGSGGFMQGLLELRGVHADYDVIRGSALALDCHADFEGFEEMFFVDAVDTFALESLFDLRVLGDVTDTEDHRED